MLVSYIRVSKSYMCLSRQLDAVIAAGVDFRNIYQEKETGSKQVYGQQDYQGYKYITRSEFNV